MGRRQHLHFYEYLDRPYDAVRILLGEEAIDLLSHATERARTRAIDLSRDLHADVAGLHLHAPIEVRVKSFEQTPADADFPYCRLRIEWEAKEHPGLFPAMEAEIDAHPLTGRETQISFFGEYRPPLGALGRGVDALVGHRLAEASVHRFVRELVDRIRELVG